MHQCAARQLFPLNRAGRFRGDIVGHPVDAFDFVDDPRGGFAKKIMLEGVIIRRHPVHRRDRPQSAYIIIGTPVAHHPDAAHRQQHHKSLPDIVIQPVFADLVDKNRVRRAQNVQFGAGQIAGTTDRQSGAGERVATNE